MTDVKVYGVALRFVILVAFNGFEVGETGCAPVEFIVRFGQYLKVIDGSC